MNRPISLNRESWMDDALCAQIDVGDVFFPEKAHMAHAAKSICNQCPVQAECLEYALNNRERWGVWGGLSERERHVLEKNDPRFVPDWLCRNGHDKRKVGVHKSGECGACRRGASRRSDERKRLAS